MENNQKKLDRSTKLYLKHVILSSNLSKKIKSNTVNIINGSLNTLNKMNFHSMLYGFFLHM